MDARVRDAIKRAEGSVQGIHVLPDDLRRSTGRPGSSRRRALIDLAAARSAFIDQSQSLNLFLAGPDHRQALVDVHLRVEVRAEDHLLPALAPGDAHPADRRSAHDEPRTAEAVACSLENPETCEACQ